MAADLGLVAHAAERHAHELAVRRARDRLAERGLADAGRADQAQDRALDPLHALRDRQVFDDAFLDLVEAVVILVEHLLRGRDVVVHLGALLPRHLDQPVDVVAHDRGLRGHRRHQLQLVELGLRLLARLLRHAGLGDALFQLAELVRGVLEVAELLLDRLHLLVEVVLALALLHLRLHAAADLLLDLQHLHLALDHGHDLLEARAHVLRFQDLLLFGKLERHVRGDGVGEAPGLLDAGERGQDLRRHLLVELDVLLEVRHDRARQHVHLALVVLLDVGQRRHVGGEVAVRLDVLDHGARDALDQHLDRAVGELEQLQDGRDRADGVEVAALRIVDVGLLLRDEQDLLVAPHGLVEGEDRLVAADEQRDHHVRVDHDVAQRQDRHAGGHGSTRGRAFLFRHCRILGDGAAWLQEGYVMGTVTARNKSQYEEAARSPVSRTVAQSVLHSAAPETGHRPLVQRQCVSDPAARRISGAATWDSSLR